MKYYKLPKDKHLTLEARQEIRQKQVSKRPGKVHGMGRICNKNA